MQKHSALPKFTTPEALGQWLDENAAETFLHETKIYLDEDEKDDLRKKIASQGIEINQLNRLKKQLSESLEKGSQGYNVDMPETLGLKMIKKGRTNLEELLERGYNTETVRIYGVPDHESETMEFFDIEGNHFPDRSRTLSQREINLFIGPMFNSQNLRKNAN